MQRVPIAITILNQVEGSYICGGAVRAFSNWQIGHDEDSKINDVDFYFINEEALKKAVAILEKGGYEEGEYGEVATTERAITYVGGWDCPAIQLIKFVHGTLIEVLDEFDFTIVKAGASSHEWIENNDYLSNLKSKLLRYTGSKLPLSSLIRVMKYVKRGYKIPALETVAIIKDITTKVDLENAKDVLYHIESFDPQYEEDDENDEDGQEDF